MLSFATSEKVRHSFADRGASRLHHAGMSIGARIKEARKKKGLTQLQVAHRLGIQRPAVTNWERGRDKPSRDNLLQLADVLDRDPGWIMTGVEGEMPDDVRDLIMQAWKQSDREYRDWLVRSAQLVLGKPADTPAKDD